MLWDGGKRSPSSVTRSPKERKQSATANVCSGTQWDLPVRGKGGTTRLGGTSEKEADLERAAFCNPRKETTGGLYTYSRLPDMLTSKQGGKMHLGLSQISRADSASPVLNSESRRHK